MSRIGFVDNAGSLFAVAWWVQNEGHEVKYFTVEDKDGSKKIGEGLVPRPKSLAEILSWAPDVVVTYNSAEADARIKKAGIPTWGSSYLTVPLEEDRLFAASVVRKYGAGRLPRMIRFTDAKRALEFLEADSGRKPWVFKAEGRPGPSSTHVCDDEEHLKAVIDYESRSGAKGFVLQEKVEGLEVSIEGWFDYRHGWLRPINSTLERKKLFSGDVGPMTGCMGSVVWEWPQEEPRLFRQTLQRIEPYLRQIKYVGPIDGNYIIDYKTREPNFLEFTPRLGWNAFEALMIRSYGWGTFFVELGRGEAKSLPLGMGFGVAVRVYTPKAPDVPLGAPLREERRIFPKDVYLDDEEKLRAVGAETASGLSVVFEVAAAAPTIQKATSEIYEEVIPLLTVPDIAYRNDIGEQAREDIEMLEAWGYVVEKD